jgi:HSP90 family molecular chaperone
MIVTTESTAVNNSGFSSSDFSMKHSAHAFKILTTSLYQNKEKAVLREYFANGYDAITESGKTDPVRIQLPTEMEPNLVFTDNGIGMDKSTLTDRKSVV